MAEHRRAALLRSWRSAPAVAVVGGCQHPWVRVLEVESLSGLARVYLQAVDRPRAWLLLGHRAGGGVGAPDLVAVREAALRERVGVGLVEQPYRPFGVPPAGGQRT